MFLKNNFKNFIIVFMLIFSTVFLIVPEKVEAVSQNVTGYAWTDTVGWIQMSGSWSNGVTLESTNGNFSGYAWSENIGWVDFAPSGPYPTSPNYSTRANITNGQVSGWARVKSIEGRSDFSGDGWISMSGSGYNVGINPTTGQFGGWAWSDDFGWIDFSKIQLTSNININFTASTNSVPYGGSTTLSWTVTGASSCSIKDSVTGATYSAPIPSSSRIMSGLTQSRTYTMECTGLGGAATSSLNIAVLPPQASNNLRIKPSVLRSGSGLSTTKTELSNLNWDVGYSGASIRTNDRLQTISTWTDIMGNIFIADSYAWSFSNTTQGGSGSLGSSTVSNHYPSKSGIYSVVLTASTTRGGVSKTLTRKVNMKVPKLQELN